MYEQGGIDNITNDLLKRKEQLQSQVDARGPLANVNLADASRFIANLTGGQQAISRDPLDQVRAEQRAVNKDLGSMAMLKERLERQQAGKTDQLALADRRHQNALALQEQRHLNSLQQLGIKSEAAAKKEAAKKREKAFGQFDDTYVPNVGFALTKDDSKKLKDGYAEKQKFDSQLARLIELRKDKGVEYLDREAVAEANQLSKDLLLTYKNMASLGVLSKADEAILNKIIPSSPLGQDWMPFQDSIMTQLETLKGNVNKDFSEKVKSRTRRKLTDFDKMSDDEIDYLYRLNGGK